MDISDFRIGEELVDNRLSVAVFNKFGIYLTIVPGVSAKQERQLAEFIWISRQDFRLGPAIVFVDINRACFGKHAFSLKWSVFEQEPSLAGIEPVQATPANTPAGLRFFQFWFIAELVAQRFS